jgi:hypothetical protein
MSRVAEEPRTESRELALPRSDGHAVGAAAVAGLWLALGILAWSRPGESGQTFVTNGLWSWLILELPSMAFPGLVIAALWLALEWWAARRATA